MKIKTNIAWVSLLALSLFLGNTIAHEAGSNKKPLIFGDGQVTVDIEKVVWDPLVVEGLTPGAEIAVLRGDLGKGYSESLLKLPPNYVVPNHSHTSDELYVWLKGAFTMIAHDGTETNFSGPAYISFPGNAPPHGLKCGPKESCLLFLSYSRPFDIKYFPEKNSQTSTNNSSSGLPAPDQVSKIWIKPLARGYVEHYTAESLLESLSYLKPAHVIPPIGRKIVWQEGTMTLKNGEVLPWRTFGKHIIEVTLNGQPTYFASITGKTISNVKDKMVITYYTRKGPEKSIVEIYPQRKIEIEKNDEKISLH